VSQEPRTTDLVALAQRFVDALSAGDMMRQ
jgi:hypothetical protein